MRLVPLFGTDKGLYVWSPVGLAIVPFGIVASCLIVLRRGLISVLIFGLSLTKRIERSVISRFGRVLSRSECHSVYFREPLNERVTGHLRII